MDLPNIVGVTVTCLISLWIVGMVYVHWITVDMEDPKVNEFMSTSFPIMWMT